MGSLQNDVDDTIERCENRISFLSNKLLESTKTAQAIHTTSENTKKSLESHTKHVKELFNKLINSNFEHLCTIIDETKEKDLFHVKYLEEHLTKDIEKIKMLMQQATLLKEQNKSSPTDFVNQSLSEIGKGPPEMPMVSLSFSAKINESALMSMQDKTREVLKLNMTSTVQIVECIERPGAIIIGWDEQQVSDSESVTTENSTFTEYILQACTVDSNNGGDEVFHTIYEGEDMQYTMKFAEPNKQYIFRVCHFHNNRSGGVCGPWSMSRKASTTLSPHMWRLEDCTTESDLQLYQISNKGRTTTKVFPESSRILRSGQASYRLGEQLTFRIDETGDHSLKDGIGLISQDKQIFKHLTQSQHATVLNTGGSIFVNGAPMVTKLPSLKKNSIVVFHASRQNSSKLRVSISVDDKEVTFDWTISTIETDTLYFACGFEHTGWQVSVG